MSSAGRPSTSSSCMPFGCGCTGLLVRALTAILVVLRRGSLHGGFVAPLSKSMGLPLARVPQQRRRHGVVRCIRMWSQQVSFRRPRACGPQARRVLVLGNVLGHT
uniref:Uncharacterized protein n=1 Tax=Calcidiscus leptoporus TaxID=127549 RepID=A0A7S0JJH2_9EUKA|mmetsp:Transcript_7503/g.17524  ORF Transcript_7503/g.17524 Transcript_7503/m.17524 type:complete len:105 (+) Transcript_7503:337-651(+)